MRRQEGLSMLAFLTGAVILIFVALFGFKVGPAYVDYYTIQRQLKIIVNEPEASTGQRRAIENAFDRRAAVENITVIQGKDLEISKDGDRVVISADYSVRVPLVGNMNACMEFSASSAR